jgi:hypothetical protein
LPSTLVYTDELKILIPCFITFKLKNTEKTINPSYIEKALDAFTGKVKSAPTLIMGHFWLSSSATNKQRQF